MADHVLLSVGAEVVLVALVAGTARGLDAARNARGPKGTLFACPGALSLDALVRRGGLQPDASRRRGMQRPVGTYSGRLYISTEELAWRPDSYSRRHGGRRISIAFASVRWAEVVPRLFRMSCVLAVGLDDGTQTRLVVRGGPAPLARVLHQLGVLLPRT
ncbi:MAG TPA: hypothetical protein VFW71_02655 [Actinomycetota bacterium]|nr:hypothetical protein [Actinomycetota bacterium]